jgi:hypothetical protein
MSDIHIEHRLAVTDTKVYFIHSVADEKLVVDAADSTDKPILTFKKHSGKNQKVSDFDTSYSVS